jgi:hypothetical protein
VWKETRHDSKQDNRSNTNVKKIMEYKMEYENELITDNSTNRIYIHVYILSMC